MRRVFRICSLILGASILVLLLGSVLVFALRLAYVEVVGPAVDADHLEAKQDYLESLPIAAANTPNIVVIFFDDLGWGDLSSYGNRFINTPHIDALADEGLRMTHFYSASPVCTPSRAALLTGRYPPRTRTDRHVFFHDNHPIGIMRRVLGYANELPREEITLAEVLNQSGYRTQMIGKWHLGSRTGYRPTDFGFDDWYGVLYSNDMYPLNFYDNDEVIIEDERIGGYLTGEHDEWYPLEGEGIDQSKLTQMYTDKAVEFLEQSGDAPFFLYLAHTFPHVPHYPAGEFAGNSRGGTYGDVVEDLDRSTGAIAEALKRLGLDENTLLIVTSDNGADYNGSAGPLRGRKQEILEGGQRVPMIARWPDRIPAGRETDAMAMNTDLFPTVLSLLELPLPSDRIIDGIDVTATLTRGVPSHEYLYYFPTTDTLPGAIRNSDFKLSLDAGIATRSREHLSPMDAYEAHEVSNLHPDTFKSLRSRLIEERERVASNPRGWAP